MCGWRSISQPRIHVGTVNRRVTAGIPAGSHLQKRREVRVANVNVPSRNIRALHLRVAAQAKIQGRFRRAFFWLIEPCGL